MEIMFFSINGKYIWFVIGSLINTQEYLINSYKQFNVIIKWLLNNKFEIKIKVIS